MATSLNAPSSSVGKTNSDDGQEQRAAEPYLLQMEIFDDKGCYF
jgi:hypothetical protein